MGILANQTKPTRADEVISTFLDTREVRSGLEAFFPSSAPVATDILSIIVETYNDGIAEDVVMFTKGDRVTFDKSSLIQIRPPYFQNYHDVSALEGFNLVPTVQGDQTPVDSSFSIVRRGMEIVNMHRRAVEKMRADILTSGMLTFNEADSINYQRQSTSMVNRTGVNRWSETTSDPFGDIEAGCQYIVDEGNSTADTFTLLLGSKALNALRNHPDWATKANLRRDEQVSGTFPDLSQATGMATHGVISAGDFLVRLTTYNQSYTAANGTRTRYIPNNQIVLIPSDFEASTEYGGLIRPAGQGFEPYAVASNAFFDVVDRHNHRFTFETRPLPVLVSVRRLYSGTVVDA